ncbi:MAG TPA: ABC transporter ATP-binding protein [Thermoanaerobaculia bacterium]|nr:ABC transporter ATP-binding protein [Thermoanaerobaculia bacterium]
MSSIICRDISVSYPAQKAPSLKEWALRRKTDKKAFDALVDVSLTIEPGEAFGVIGGNGAGKSTLLRVIAGIVPPTRGEVITRGVLAPIIELGTGFDGELSGRENIFFNGSLLGRSKAFMRRCEEEIIDFSGISDFIDAPLRTYSTGMIARLAFAVATTVEAEIVLLDEVLAVGDASFREKCEERIRRFHQTGASILLVSHDLKSVREVCERAAWIDHGRVITIGNTDEVVDAYERGLHALPQPAVAHV